MTVLGLNSVRGDIKILINVKISAIYPRKNHFQHNLKLYRTL